ncbi:MAG: hypothetical protein HY042_10775, partial [Spirochaetia bacterium]|nr:hypothetical protein [Spirochaetia bacterium]
MSAVRVDGRDMAGLVDKLLADKNSGLKTDDTGRRYFRQRHVQFHTIEIQAKDLHGPGWLDFETDLALDWNKDPSHEEIRSFAVKSSHRFLSFWYRVFDVAAARSLSGRDRTVFRRAFFKASAFADLGVPDESAFSSVPPLLHRKILDEYKASKPFRSAYRIYYLSDYLEGLTDDMNAVLRPYRRLWRLQDARARILRQLDAIHAEVESALVGNPGARSDDDAASAETVSPLRQAEDFLELCGLSALDRSLENKTYVKIEDETARMLVFRRRTGALDSLEKDDIERIFHEPVFSVPGAAQTLLALMSLPARCHTSARRAASFSTQAHRLRLRLVRYQRLHGTKEGGSEALALRLRDAESRLAKIMEELKRPMGLAPLQSLADRYLMVLRMLRGIDQRIEELYTLPSNRTDPSDIPPTGTAGREAPTEHRDSRFMEAGTVVLPVDVIPGDPFAEPLVVSLAKQVVLKRLRPVRMTANYYSLNPAHRHGCMTLNPVMKLWKERPHTGTRDLPRLCGLEMNTKETIECLVRLASIADPV